MKQFSNPLFSLNKGINIGEEPYLLINYFYIQHNQIIVFVHPFKLEETCWLFIYFAHSQSIIRANISFGLEQIFTE